MAQTDFPTLIPARVMASLSPLTVTLVLWPGRRDEYDLNGQPTETTATLNIDLVPVELRKPNSDVWVIVKGIHGDLGKLIDFERQVVFRMRNEKPIEYGELPRFDDYCPHTS